MKAMMVLAEPFVLRRNTHGSRSGNLSGQKSKPAGTG